MDYLSKLKQVFENAQAVDFAILESNLKFLHDLIPSLTTKFYFESNTDSSALIIPNSVYFNEYGQIIRLNLAENNLSFFPDSFAHLSALEFLDLSFNRFTMLPSFFSNFSHLKFINLEHNLFGEFPKVLEFLPSLEQVLFANNEIRQLPWALCGVSFHLQLTENFFQIQSENFSQKFSILDDNPLQLDGDSVEIWKKALEMCLQECPNENASIKFTQFQEFLSIIFRLRVLTKYAERGLEVNSDHYMLLL